MERCRGVLLESSTTSCAEGTTTRCQITKHPLISLNKQKLTAQCLDTKVAPVGFQSSDCPLGFHSAQCLHLISESETEFKCMRSSYLFS